MSLEMHEGGLEHRMTSPLTLTEVHDAIMVMYRLSIPDEEFSQEITYLLKTFQSDSKCV